MKIMNKTAQTELHRTFLIERLPEPLIPASSHLQIFDNYIENTRLRLRKIRDPYSSAWTRMLQQRFTVDDNNFNSTRISELHLDENEYSVFERLEGCEIRKNRYFHEVDLVSFIFDVYLGSLWGLTISKVYFETVEQRDAFTPPPFAVFEITNDPFFVGDVLVGKNFNEIQSEIARLGSVSSGVVEFDDE